MFVQGVPARSAFTVRTQDVLLFKVQQPKPAPKLLAMLIAGGVQTASVPHKGGAPRAATVSNSLNLNHCGKHTYLRVYIYVYVHGNRHLTLQPANHSASHTPIFFGRF